MNISLQNNFAAQSSCLRVDHEAGVIKGVSVVTIGDAKGHGLIVDSETLNQIKLCADKKGKVPVRADHGSGVMHVCGHLINFRIKGQQLVADWKLLKKFGGYEQILETAEEQPETVGLSVSFRAGDDEQLTNGLRAARCEELLSTDYVIHPAANPGGLLSTNFSIIGPKARLGLLLGGLIAHTRGKQAIGAIGKIAQNPFAKAAMAGGAGALGGYGVRKALEKAEAERAARGFQRNFRQRKIKQSCHMSVNSGGASGRKSPAHQNTFFHATGAANRRGFGDSHLSPTRALSAAAVPAHFGAIEDAITKLQRVPGPVGRQPRPGPATGSLSGSAPQSQARDNGGRFTPGPASTPEKMRDAYVDPAEKPALGLRFRSARMALRRAQENSNV